MKFKLIFQLIQNMGLRYFLYRINHEFKKKTKLINFKHPFPKNLKVLISKAELLQRPNFILNSVLNSVGKVDQLKFKAEKILNGEILFFNHEWKKLGLSYDWVTNPENGYKYNATKHWSEINDFKLESGDIKFVWEKSRFSYLLIIMRYDFHFNENHAKFVFEEIESWIDANQVNKGPNWKCSQEISLRIFNWLFLIDFYKDSEELTEERWNKIQNVIYWSLHHVYENINFSRIAVRNNHAITETLFLALSEMMFPFIPETKKWARKGRKWFEKEIEYQIYEDGTYLQFSMNYHRVVIQLLSLAFTVSEKNNNIFSSKTYVKAYKSLDFLYQCLQEENGKLPNYGSNDGALFFPLSDFDYRDYRPQLNNLHYILTGQHLFNDNIFIQEDSIWLDAQLKNNFPAITKKIGAISFPFGGFYLLRDSNSFSMIRCGKHKDRPSQADNLHLDIWVNGENVLRDSGTYKYNTLKEYTDYFTGTISHNTVSIGDKSQMLKGNRFIWYFWSQSLIAKCEDNGLELTFDGSISAFRHINKECIHQRKIIKVKDELKWIVEDIINEKGVRQNWHKSSSFDVNLKAFSSDLELIPNSFKSFDSSYYGSKINTDSNYFQFDFKIKTEINISK